MSALDQAFVKAFEPTVSSAAAAVASLAPEPAALAEDPVSPVEATATSPGPADGKSESPTRTRSSPERRSRPARQSAVGTRGRARSSARADGKTSRERPIPSRSTRSDRNAADDTDLSTSAKFRPMLEVDGYLWPRNVGKLASPSHRAMSQMTDEVRKRIQRGQKVIGLRGCRLGDGCSTLLLAVARRLAADGLRVAMVDADFHRPTLARRLGLSPTVGWEEVAPGRLTLADVTVESLRDRLCLVPWCASAATEPPSIQPSQKAKCIDELRRHYHVVLVDLGSPAPEAHQAELSQAVLARLDAILVVCHAGEVSASELEGVCQRLADSSKAELAVVENFV